MNGRNRHSVILFDGICNLCCGLVNLIIRHDPRRSFAFVPLQSELGKCLQRDYHLQDKRPDAIVFVENGSAYFQSTAMLKILRRLGGAWSLLSALIVLPAGLRDAVYNVIAKNRYRIFGKRDACPAPSQDVADRFKNRKDMIARPWAANTAGPHYRTL